jgi:hypothetical protein
LPRFSGFPYTQIGKIIAAMALQAKSTNAKSMDEKNPAKPQSPETLATFPR